MLVAICQKWISKNFFSFIKNILITFIMILYLIIMAVILFKHLLILKFFGIRIGFH